MTFDTNTADSGGGLAATGTTLTMSDCYFARNNAQASGTGRGGAMLCEEHAAATDCPLRPLSSVTHQMQRLLNASPVQSPQDI